MNDLPQNELFSAYLDGELTAAEQAEMERLLATSPAARQLLDELRALSNTLQALPQEKLGEDLSRQVLRVAERRMLTEGEPGETETAPVPLGRSVFRRFLSRRAMVWLGLAVAVAVMITINERRQGVRPAADAAKEVVLARSEKPAKRPSPPPSIHAARDNNEGSLKAAHALVERKSETAAAPVPKESAAPAPLPATEAPAETKPAARPGSMAKTGPVRARGGTIAEKAGDVSPSMKKDSNVAFGAKQPPDRFFAKGGQKAVGAEQAEKSAEVGQGMLVVRCDISPEAAKKQAFEKLLFANGITRHEQHDRDSLAYKAKADKGKVAQDAKHSPFDEEMSRSSAVAGKENLIYVEATAAQIEAVLAGLAAQPHVFLSNSVQREAIPRNGPATLGAVPPAGWEFMQRTQVAGPDAGRGAVGQLDIVVRDRMQQQPVADESPSAFSGSSQNVAQPPSAVQNRLRQPGAAVPQVDLGIDPKSMEDGRQAGDRSQQQQLAQPAPRQRVLFVLNVAGGGHPPAAAKAGSGLGAGAAKPAEAASPPANLPVQGK